MNRTLDYRPRLDERNRAYRLTAADPALLQKSRYWTPGVVMNQQAEGSCVGHGVTGEYMASPVRGKPPGGKADAFMAHLLAKEVYRRCLQIDEFEGERDEGTSVRAGMLVGRERGWWTGFRWAFNLLELRAALEEGPVVIGVEWLEGMYETLPTGQVWVAGSTVGGHCLLITGYTPNWNKLGPFYRWRNSWGPEYGINGSGYIHADDLDAILFQAGGEAAVAMGRAA